MPEENTNACATFPSSSDTRAANNSTRQTWRVLSEAEKARVDAVKELGATFIGLCHEIGGTDPDGERLASRHLSLAVTHVEDAVMRAVRHITK
ncbi:hypothetical protein ACLGGT_14310 [Roseovarius sp. MS2]|uniref:Acb2/Tad1 domain-containing protein n=1 Tax=Roseovarius sp. MS2 TaxID=3390728 RepID=UPI003EDBD60C